MSLLESFEIIKNELDNVADERNLTVENSPQYADVVTAVDKFAKVLMMDDFAKEKDNEDRTRRYRENN